MWSPANRQYILLDDKVYTAVAHVLNHAVTSRTSIDSRSPPSLAHLIPTWNVALDNIVLDTRVKTHTKPDPVTTSFIESSLHPGSRPTTPPTPAASAYSTVP